MYIINSIFKMGIFKHIKHSLQIGVLLNLPEQNPFSCTGEDVQKKKKSKKSSRPSTAGTWLQFLSKLGRRRRSRRNSLIDNNMFDS